MTGPIKSISSILLRLSLPFSMASLFACPAGAQPAKTEIIAHRGGCALFPENTCVAFRACEGFADRIEFDVRVSADGEHVVIHDETVDRTTDGSGAVADLTLAQLKALDAGSHFSSAFAGERIPTLAEALRALPPGIPALVDCKTGSAEAIVNALRSANALSNAVIACGGLDLLQAVRRLDSSIELAFAGNGELGPNNVAVAKRMGVNALAWDKVAVTPALLDLARSVGWRVFVFSPTPSEVPFFLDLGVDGIYADDPVAVHQAVQQAARSRAPSPAQTVRSDPLVRSQRSGPAELVRDLVAYWKLDDGLADPSAVNAEEAAGNSRGRLAGFASSPGWVSGADAFAGGALRLDGRDDYVRIPPNEFLDVGANAVSLSLWVKLSVLPSRLSEDFSFIYGSDLASYCLYLDRNQGELQFRATDANRHSASPGIPEAALQTGVWHHVAGVYDGSAAPGAGRVSIYLDGQLQDAHVGADASPGLGLTQAVLPGQFAALGRHGDQDEFYFSGSLDDVALWRRALSPAEIVLIHASGSEHVPLDRIKDVR